MSNLSNLYISQSYKGLINLADSTQGINSQSNYELQDGLGNGIGVSVLSGSLLVDNEISSSTVAGMGNVYAFSQSVDNRLDQLETDTGSQDARLDLLEIASASLQNYTASLKEAFSVSGTNADFNGDVTISGSLRAYEIHTIVESASVIFSSGSNTLGDEPTDVQILSGSVYVPNLHYLAGNPIDTDLRINQKLDTGSYLTDSASFDARINSKLDASWTGSVFLPFSSSVASELANIVADALPSSWTGSVFLPFSTSIDARMSAQEAFSSSLVFDFVTTGEFNTYTSSTAAIIDGKLNTSSYETDSASFDARIDALEDFSTSLDANFVSEVEFAAFSSSNDTRIANETNRIDVLSSFTGSYATTGSNVFNGNQLIQGNLDVSGSSSYTGSLRGNVTYETGSTFVIDCNEGNFFDFQLSAGSNYLIGTNIKGGETITVRLLQPAVTSSYASITWDTGSLKFPRFQAPYTTNGAGAVDIITFVSFDTGSLYGILLNDYN